MLVNFYFFTQMEQAYGSEYLFILCTKVENNSENT
jgi:hypothetical protein